jgi:hypothetical protein
LIVKFEIKFGKLYELYLLAKTYRVILPLGDSLNNFTVDRTRLKERLGKTNREIMERAKRTWQIAFDTEEW